LSQPSDEQYADVILKSGCRPNKSLDASGAGGRVSDYHNRPLDIFTPPILATNGLIHEQMMGVLAI